MNEMVTWVSAHIKDVCAIITAVIGVATLVVKLTPTQKDDNVLARVVKVLEALSLCNADGSFTGATKACAAKADANKEEN
ncbi:MAG: hypothetical protein IKJ44_00835 [Elusimicrobiaceae bacterium]|nr:hypothetical protein [Elusimicrobiaceae bacterium]